MGSITPSKLKVFYGRKKSPWHGDIPHEYRLEKESDGNLNAYGERPNCWFNIIFTKRTFTHIIYN